MKKQVLRLVIPLCLVVGRLTAVEINFTSPALEIGKISTNAVLTTGFTFTLGSFGGFTPTTGNEALWQSNFTALGSTAWGTDWTQYSGTATLASNNAPFSTLTQGYVWGYNSQAFITGSEWVLLTNPAWLFPLYSGTTVGWDSFDTGTIAIVGSFSSSLSADPYLQTASVGAIPEPSTFAALLGFAAIGIAAWRRRRA
jgi:hypothetical protein